MTKCQSHFHSDIMMLSHSQYCGYKLKISEICICISDWTITPTFSTDVETINCSLQDEFNELSINLKAKLFFKMSLKFISGKT